MAHIHDLIDFTVAIFVVHAGRVLLVHHRKLDAWLPLGGHIELDEDPETAARREAREESGLDVELLGERPPTTGPGTRALIAPRFLDIHRITATHQHIGLIYWARPEAGSLALADPIERNVDLPLDTALNIPVGFAMAKQTEAGLGCHRRPFEIQRRQIELNWLC